jgi:hypothetical protein
VNEFLYKLGLRLMRWKFVQRAIEERADLSEFRKRPTLRILAGVFLICFSMCMSWPILVAVFGGLALHFHKPWIATLIVPLYVLSHVCYLTGMYLSGEKYVRIFLRWTVRRFAERLLSYGEIQESV